MPWSPVPYYYTSPLEKLKPLSAKLPHSLGYIPKYLKGKRVQILKDLSPLVSRGGVSPGSL